MRVGVAGLWHLGCVTAACVAEGGHDVIAYDPSVETISKLQGGLPPISEPGLKELIAENVANKRLEFSSNPAALNTAEIVWVTFDTPVDNEDGANVDLVLQEVEKILPHLQYNALVIISSQIPVGTTHQLQERCQQICPQRNISFACIPENLRLGAAIKIFMQPDRIVVGLESQNYKNKIEELLKPFSDQLIWMSIVSAEMTKHAINSFLALSVTFINEFAALCETVGANAKEVERGLKSEERIGAKAYLRPGEPIAGGTLMRDVNYLTKLGEKNGRDTFLLSAVRESNHYHKTWACRKLKNLLKDLAGKKVAVLGLTYKPDTDTLRRSTSIELCEWLHQQGVKVNAFDPAISVLPEEFSHVFDIKLNAKDALHAADAVVIATAWPDFHNLSAEDFVTNLKYPRVLDASGFMDKYIGNDKRIEYFTVGVSS